MGADGIISVADKLKNLRQKYNVKQEEVSGNDVTRNLISQIEHGKANLTKSVAETVIKNLKNICTKRHIRIDETVEYLMEDEKSQADKMLDKYIAELKDLSFYKDDSFTYKLNQVENFMANWDLLDKKIAIFELAGDYFFRNNDLYKSSLYYEKAKALINSNVHNEKLVSIFRKLSMVYYYMNKYEEDIKCCDFALKRFPNMSKEYYSIFIFNSSLCYIEIKEYRIALLQLKKIESIVKEINMDKYYELLEQEGVCFQYLKEYDKSLSIFNQVINSLSKDNHESYIIALFNLVDTYIKLDNVDMARKYLKDISENIDGISQSSKRVSQIYCETAKLCKKLNDLKLAKAYFLKSLDYAKLYNQYSIANNTLSDLFDIYVIDEDDKRINEIKDIFLSVIGKGEKINLQFINKLIDYYLDKKDYESLREIHNYMKSYVRERGCCVS
ncbi:MULTISPECIES: helix-turn-helix transcriptional regulator [Clostridium]|uniref:helix-turn-helix transcriptional regulator n=1 Tax=Clostridium TaxID=1485 RepID=UPI000824AC5E|nr:MULTISPECIES: helix-turn-helix transcriptional regulator [Clostridium]PJI10524.1 transcriptional regulator [Clostridium sp. CT7]